MFDWMKAGKAIATPIEAIGKAIDAVTTTDEERMAGQAILNKIALQPSILNAELNKVEAQHSSIFVAGWRPTIGYICALGLAFPFVINPIIQWATGEVGPELPLDAILELALGMLGLATLRTYEKIQGKTK